MKPDATTTNEDPSDETEERPEPTPLPETPAAPPLPAPTETGEAVAVSRARTEAAELATIAAQAARLGLAIDLAEAVTKGLAPDALRASVLNQLAVRSDAAAIVAVPLGFAIGMSPLLFKALNPFIQVLKPISPLAWMPLALYTIKDSTISSIFVIFICSIWPMLINTAHGVASVRRDWLNVARTLEVGRLRTAFRVVLPAAAPTILTGMRISMGIAWLVIVAAEMLVGGTGIGYFVWNEWNNLSLTNVIFAILMIGVVGMLLDLVFGLLTRLVSYQE